MTSRIFHGARLSRLSSSIGSIPKCLRLVANETASSSIDSIFFLTGAQTLFGILVLLYSKLAGLRTLAFVYGKDALTAGKSPFGFISLMLALGLSRRVATNSRFTLRLLPRFARRKTGVLYPGVDPLIRETLRTPKSSEKTKTVLFVGRLVERKGVGDLLYAFALLLHELPNSRLEVVGDGPQLADLRLLAEKLQLLEAVRFLGTLTGRDLYERFSAADVFVMPSKRLDSDVEGFGTVFLEAGLFGKASVGTRSGGVPEAVVDGITGLLVSEGDPQALADGILTLLRDDILRMRLGSNARERVLADFTWERSARELVSLMTS